MRIGFIGAGKVGTAFGMYLKTKGYDIAGYYSRSLASSAQAASFTGTRYFQKDFELVVNIDILFITTNDEQIKPVIDRLASRNLLREGQIVVHMSGTLPSDILDNARAKGCSTYSMHPIQAFADVSKALEALPQTVFSIEGDEDNIDVLEAMLKKIGNRFFRIAAENKTIYHAAACIFSNYLVTLMDQGISFLDSIGIKDEEGFKAMLPLINGTIANIDLLGTENALTGPIARGDYDTIAGHLESIGSKLPDKLELYKALAEATLELAKKSKLKDTGKINRLEELLNNR